MYVKNKSNKACLTNAANYTVNSLGKLRSILTKLYEA